MVGQHHGVEYCSALDIDNFNVGVGRIFSSWTAPQSTSEKSTERRCRDVKLMSVPATFTAVAQPLERAFMQAFKACMARLATEHFAGILVATAPDDPVTFDLSVGNLKPVLLSWVCTAIAKIAKGTHFMLLGRSDSNSRHVGGGVGKRSGHPRRLSSHQSPRRLRWTTSRGDDEARQTTKDWARAKQTLSRQPTMQRHPQNKQTNPGQRQMQRRQPVRKQTSRQRSD